jgi:hypothetical protein
VHQSTTFDFDRVRRRFSGVYWLRKCLPMICKREEKRSLSKRDPEKAKRRHAEALSEIETDDQKKSRFLIGRELASNYFFQLFLDCLKRLTMEVVDFHFLAEPFFHFSLHENTHKGLQIKSSHFAAS